MLARRLLALVAVLLVIAAIATAIAPRDSGNDNATTTTTTTAAAPPASSPAGSTVTAALPGPVTGTLKVVRANVGDHIELTVSAASPDTVAIEGYDEIQAADPAAPARFDFIADQPGTFAVTLLDADAVVGRLEIGTGA